VLPERLQTADVPSPVRSVLDGLEQRGFRAFLVGGCVRDLLRGVPPKDWDVATAATPAQVQASFPRVLPTGIQHGTVTVLVKGTHVEVTTFRTEGGYVDGRRPTAVTFRTDVVEDLSRRDFTINAMAFSPTRGELADPFDGQGDLSARLVRAVGDPVARFSEDGLRSLRAVRFSTVLDFTLHPDTQAAIPTTLQVFRKVSTERVRDEFEKTLMSPRAAPGLALLQQVQLLPEFLPELRPGPAFAAALRALAVAPPLLEVRLVAVLLAAAGLDVRSAVLRLRFPNRTADLAAALAREAVSGVPPADTAVELRRLLARLRPENVPLLEALVVARAEAVGEGTRARDFAGRLRDEAARRPPLDAKALALDGAAIMRALGVGPSPVVGEASRFLLERVLEEPSANTPEQLTSLIQGWAASRR
jgi:tRNA nucleotidyltransferase (CCA-adding enzyme)